MRHSLCCLILLAGAAGANDAVDRLSDTYPQLKISHVAPAAVDGWLTLETDAGQVLYLSPDGDHLFVGELIEVATRDNLTEATRSARRADQLAGYEPTFRFPAQDPVAEVTVITDIDCPYCRRLHQQIEGYNDRGISVNYLMLPRAGRSSGSWQKAVAAACATDPEGALTDAMNGVDLAPASCEHRIGNEFTLARSLRSTGTPAFVLADGRLFDGFVGPADLAERLE